MKKLKKTLITYDIELVELMSGVAALSWGLWLLIPTLNSFESAITFDAMSSIAPEWMWGFGMLVIGAVQIESVITHTLKRRKISSLLLSILWLFITAVFAYSNFASTAVVIYAVFTVFTMWSYLRLSQRFEITSKFLHK